MKKILLIGHMPPETSHEYQKIMCQEIKERLGDNSSPEIIFLGLNCAKVSSYLKKSDYDGLYEFLQTAIRPFTGMVCGAVVCSNTVHVIVPRLEAALGLPFIHVADCAGDYALSKGFKKVALFGTSGVMTGDFYKIRLEAKGLGVVIPNEKAQEYINSVVREKLFNDIVLKEDREIFYHIIEELRDEGAEVVILACNKIPLLIQEGGACIPIINTMTVNVVAAVDFMLS